jgi:tetratricopeptide (TPR) repeat protein
MYRITTGKPVPLHERWPDCPESLDAIIRRAMDKHRVLRYQNAADICVDFQELIRKLRTEQAELLFESAKREAAAGELEAAHACSRRALEYDPASQEIRKFRDEIRQEIEREARRSQVSKLLSEADELLANRSYNAAIELLEQALADDESNSTIAGKLAEVRQRQKARREAALLVASAREELNEGALDSAKALIERAAGTDPDNTAIPLLQAQLAVAIEAREKHDRIAAALVEIDRLRMEEQFSEALMAVESLIGREGTTQEIAMVRERITADEQVWRARKAEEEYRERLKQISERLDNAELSVADLNLFC